MASEKTVAELKAEFDELKAKIKSNSKDAHFANILVDNLVSTTKQLNVEEPPLLNVGKALDKFEGKTFCITKTDQGCLYHEYGGYNIFVTPKQWALFSTLTDFVDNKDVYNNLGEEERDMYDMNMSAIAYCLSVPKFCFTDVEFTYEIATKVIDFLRKKYDEGIDKPLQDETPVENAEFEEYLDGLQTIDGMVKELDNK